MEDWREPLNKWKIRINKKGKAVGEPEVSKEVKELNADLEEVRWWKKDINSVKLSQNFMRNYDNNLRVIEELELGNYVADGNRYAIKPMELKDLIRHAYEVSCEEHLPFTVATLCVKIGFNRDRLADILSKKGYEEAKTMTQNLLLIYAENNLFTGKNVAGAIFYLKNVFPELYKDKNETDINIKSISLVKLAGKAEELKWKRINREAGKRQRGKVVEGEELSEAKD